MAAVSLFRAQIAAVTSCENDPLIGQKNLIIAFYVESEMQ